MKKLLRYAVASGVAVITASPALAQQTFSIADSPAAEIALQDEDASSPSDRVGEDEAAIPHSAPYYTSAPAPRPAAPASQPIAVSQSSKKTKEELTAAMKGAYKGLFYANNFAYLNSPLFDGPYFPGDNFKQIADKRLDLGGEFRSRYHSERNMRGLGLTGRDDQFWLTRLRFFANYKITENVRFYGEYLYADSGGETFGPGMGQRPIEENRGEAQNLFLDFKLLDSLSARVGRQELLLGAQRLVSPLDWANTRRTFDGYRLTHSTDSNTVDLFYTNPVSRSFATAGTNEWDSSDNLQHFYGVYNTFKGLDIGALETYYIAYDNDNTNFSFHTLGSRLAGSNDAFLYEFEGGVQFGRNSDGSDHGAGFVTAGLGKQLSLMDGSWKPTVWAWYDWASGGEPVRPAQGDDAFHHYFPLAHKYNGFMDLFGRRNLNDVNLQFITPVGKRVKFLLWYHYFFLDQATTPYSVVMTPYNTDNSAVSKDLGHEIDCLFNITLNERNSMLIGYSFFAAGNYYNTPGVQFNGDADFFYCQYQSRF
ncbi:MAG: alginate export family protein [Aureliella sp.]